MATRGYESGKAGTQLYYQHRRILKSLKQSRKTSNSFSKMATITLVQAARQTADHIYQMTAQPNGVVIENLAGGAVQFQCSNDLATLQGATSVQITYDATVPGDPHESVQVSSILS